MTLGRERIKMDERLIHAMAKYHWWKTFLSQSTDALYSTTCQGIPPIK